MQHATLVHMRIGGDFLQISHHRRWNAVLTHQSRRLRFRKRTRPSFDRFVDRILILRTDSLGLEPRVILQVIPAHQFQ